MGDSLFQDNVGHQDDDYDYLIKLLALGNFLFRPNIMEIAYSCTGLFDLFAYFTVICKMEQPFFVLHLTDANYISFYVK